MRMLFRCFRPHKPKQFSFFTPIVSLRSHTQARVICTYSLLNKNVLVLQGYVCSYEVPEVTWRGEKMCIWEILPLSPRDTELSVFLGQVGDMETTGRGCTYLWQGYVIILSLNIKPLNGCMEVKHSLSEWERSYQGAKGHVWPRHETLQKYLFIFSVLLCLFTWSV